MQIKIENKFSLNARFNAIPVFFSMDIFLVIDFITDSGRFKNLLLKNFPNFIDNCFLLFLSLSLK